MEFWGKYKKTLDTKRARILRRNYKHILYLFIFQYTIQRVNCVFVCVCVC